MVYPNSNLPTASQPWGKAMQRDLEALQATVATNEVNNKARDAQLNAAQQRLAGQVTSLASVQADLQTTINSITSVEEAVFVPGTTQINGGNIAANTIAANKISAGDLIGFNIKTDTNGQRVELNGTNDDIRFYNSSNQLAGSIAGGIYGGSPYVSVSGNLIANNTILSSVSAPGSCDFGATMVDSLYSSGLVDANSLQVTNGSTFYSSISTAGISNTGGIGSTGSISTDGNLNRTLLSGGGTTGASFNNNGSLIRTTSSQRYKTDIQPLSILYSDIIALEPKTFKRTEEVEQNPEAAATYPGFIAEDLADTSLDVFVFRNAEGQPEGIHYAELSAALLYAIKQQDAMIKSLSDRIDKLEGK